jgi:hypothetical protein
MSAHLVRRVAGGVSRFAPTKIGVAIAAGCQQPNHRVSLLRPSHRRRLLRSSMSFSIAATPLFLGELAAFKRRADTRAKRPRSIGETPTIA